MITPELIEYLVNIALTDLGTIAKYAVIPLAVVSLGTRWLGSLITRFRV